MEVLEFIIGFFIALFVAGLLFYGFKRRGPWNAFWVFLLLLVLASWGGRLWLTPAGPEFWGYGWLSVFFWVFVFGLLIALADPSGDSERTGETIDYEPDTKTRITSGAAGSAAAFGLLFWFLLILMIIAIIGGLWY